MRVLESQRERHPLQDIGQAVSGDELRTAQDAVRQVYADDLIKEYIVDLANATRRHPDIYLGVSPRGSLALFKASRAYAALHGRTYVIPDDVKALLEATFAHRLIISPSARHQECGIPRRGRADRPVGAGARDAHPGAMRRVT